MRASLRDYLLFLVERLLLRGAHWRLLVIAMAIGLIAVAGGVLVLAAGERFDSLGSAVWWAFLRLTDPGYLGDDVGTWRRVISTILTVAGYVIFLGALVAVMTQWLNATIRNLERGLTPIVQHGHILLLGWTDRTPIIAREIVLSEGRVRRFLERHRTRRLTIVILAEEVTPDMVQELRERLGERYDERRVILRSGTPLRAAHLARVDFLNASAIVLPGADFMGSTADDEAAAAGLTVADTMAIKILLSISRHSAERDEEARPLVVAEIVDGRKAAVAEQAYGGPVQVVASDLLVARVIAQNVRHPGLSHVASELLTHSHGNEIFVREPSGVAGRTLGEVERCYRRAVVLGIVRREGRRFLPLLGAHRGTPLVAGDRIVLMAHEYDDTEPEAPLTEVPAPAPARPAPPAAARQRRVLMLGWSHRVPALLGEFGAYAGDEFDVTVVSALPVAQRERQLARYGDPPEGVRVRHVEADFTVPAELERLDAGAYDNIVVLGSSWLETREASDARTILGYLLLRRTLPAEGRPPVLIELMDPENLALFREQPGEVIISPEIVSHILAQVALRPELGAVFDELFGPEGSTIDFHDAGLLGLAGREVGFQEVIETVAAVGGVALGLRFRDQRQAWNGGVALNPPRDARWTLEATDQVVVLEGDHGKGSSS